MWPSNGGPPPPNQQQQQQPPPPPQNQQQQQQQQGPPPPQQQQQHWSPQPPPNGQYTPRPNQNQIPPISQAVPQGPTMTTLQPQHPDQYRALPPPQLYPPQYAQAQMGYAPAQPAPRQRTAIACRYCRRRKIRCSGFDQSEDGRCTNCQRFSQECVFTPVSAQTQAFVPAHTVWRGQQPPPNTQLYGAYGQPLPQHGARDPYQGQQQPQQPQGQYPPPPHGYQQPPMYGQPPPQQGTPNEAGRKRGTDEPHTPTLPPPNPAAQADGQPRYPYADPSGMPPGASPAFYPTSSYHPAYTQPYHPMYAQPQAGGAWPQNAYPPEVAQIPSSPQNVAEFGMPNQVATAGLAGARVRREGAVKINDIVSPAQKAHQHDHQVQTRPLDGRTSTDSSMVTALNRGPRSS